MTICRSCEKDAYLTNDAGLCPHCAGDTVDPIKNYSVDKLVNELKERGFEDWRGADGSTVVVDDSKESEEPTEGECEEQGVYNDYAQGEKECSYYFNPGEHRCCLAKTHKGPHVCECGLHYPPNTILPPTQSEAIRELFRKLMHFHVKDSYFEQQYSDELEELLGGSEWKKIQESL